MKSQLARPKPGMSASTSSAKVDPKELGFPVISHDEYKAMEPHILRSRPKGRPKLTLISSTGKAPGIAGVSTSGEPHNKRRLPYRAKLLKAIGDKLGDHVTHVRVTMFTQTYPDGTPMFDIELSDITAVTHSEFAAYMVILNLRSAGRVGLEGTYRMNALNSESKIVEPARYILLKDLPRTIPASIVPSAIDD